MYMIFPKKRITTQNPEKMKTAQERFYIEETEQGPLVSRMTKNRIKTLFCWYWKLLCSTIYLTYNR